VDPEPRELLHLDPGIGCPANDAADLIGGCASGNGGHVQSCGRRDHFQLAGKVALQCARTPAAGLHFTVI
jgi:hypothetical protein